MKQISLSSWKAGMQRCTKNHQDIMSSEYKMPDGEIGFNF